MARPAHRVPAPAPLAEYWRASRAPRYSLLVAMPLLVAYEALAAFLSTGQSGELRNGADVVLRELFLTVAGQRYAPLAFGVTLIGLGTWFIARDMRRAQTPLRGWVFALMLVEASVFALCFGTVIGSLTSHLLGVVGIKNAADVLVARVPGVVGPVSRSTTGFMLVAWLGAPAAGPIASAPTATKVMLALGAGVYEELLFRVLLVSAVAFLARRVFRWRPSVAAGLAIVLSALVFAAFHYIGPYGDPLRVDSFVFRFIGGLAFSVLYVTRGFGVTAWTHSLYDLLTLVA